MTVIGCVIIFVAIYIAQKRAKLLKPERPTETYHFCDTAGRYIASCDLFPSIFGAKTKH